MPRSLRFQALAFIGSFLAFCLELAAAKLLLPRFGGSAYVWTGSLMFFQALLLVSYLYGRRARLHPRTHAVVLALPFFFLPLALPETAPTDAPFAQLFWGLLRSVGVPFFVLSTTVVISQSWLMRSNLPKRDDGYFLYAASNAGAAAALLAYPLLVEPGLNLTAQGRLWFVLYAAYAALCLSCLPSAAAPRAEAPAGPSATGRERARWLLLSAAPSAALLAASNLLSMDFAAVPLLWTVPLATYLLTFVLNFKREPWYPERLNRAMLPAVLLWVAACVAFFVLAARYSENSTPAQLLGRVLDLGKFAYVLFALFAVSMIFHKSLAVGRPASEELMPEYYSWIAAGGLLGSALIGLVVPYFGRRVDAVALDWSAVGAVAAAAMITRDWEQISVYRKTAAGLAALALAGVAAVFAAGNRAGSAHSLRNFYGIYSVRDQGGTRLLFHGNTDHGEQFLDPARQDEPLAYYGKASPLGEAWAELGPRWRSVGVVGLGAGSLAAYGRRGMVMDFYELDPDVADIAARFFTFLSRSSAAVRVVTGDARLSLERADGAAYDALVLDAFNSGSVPVHLLTTQAFSSYLRRLTPEGVILIHVSNRYLDLRRPLAATAGDLGLAAAVKRQEFHGLESDGRSASAWVAIARDPKAVERLVEKRGWTRLKAGTARAWTDEHASLLPTLTL